MTDPADTNGSTPPPTAEQDEQLRLMTISMIAQQAAQLLALVGVGVVDGEQLHRGAAALLAQQDQLTAQLNDLIQGPQATQFPIFGATVKKADSSTIIVPGQPAPSGFQVAGPKRLAPQNEQPANAVGILTTLALYTQPHLRLALNVLGLQVVFVQYPPQPAPAPKKIWPGMAR